MSRKQKREAEFHSPLQGNVLNDHLQGTVISKLCHVPRVNPKDYACVGYLQSKPQSPTVREVRLLIPASILDM